MIEIMAGDGTKAQFFPERGGMMTSLIIGGQERLYVHDFLLAEQIDDLPGGLPFLFPVCGRVEYRGKLGFYSFNDKEYQLPIHGFSWNKAWQLINKGEDFIEIRLSHDETSLQIYPFRFEIILRYEISPGEIVCYQRYKNLGDEALPYNSGFHPYFKNATQINLAPLKQFFYNEKFTQFSDEKKLNGSLIQLNYSQINQQLFLLDENKVEVTFADGQVLLMKASAEFPYLQLYTQSGKEFICVEPWMGFPNAINSAQGMRWLEPGGVEFAEIEIALCRPREGAVVVPAKAGTHLNS